jgi:hypothetical protein
MPAVQLKKSMIDKLTAGERKKSRPKNPHRKPNPLPKVDGRKRKSNAGRPTVMTPEVMRKLEQAFTIDCSIEEACSFAGIGTTSFFEYQRKHPEYTEVVQSYRNRLAIRARQALAKTIDEAKNAQWWLERKRRAEFAMRQEVTGADGGAIKIQDCPMTDDEIIAAVDTLKLVFEKK